MAWKDRQEVNEAVLSSSLIPRQFQRMGLATLGSHINMHTCTHLGSSQSLMELATEQANFFQHLSTVSPAHSMDYKTTKSVALVYITIESASEASNSVLLVYMIKHQHI